MLTTLVILGIVVALMLLAGFICIAADHGFFYWFFVLPEVTKAVGYVIVLLLSALNE